MNNLKGLYLGSMLLLLVGVVGGGFAAYTAGTHKEEPAAVSSATPAESAAPAEGAAKTDAAAGEAASTGSANSGAAATGTDADKNAAGKTDTGKTDTATPTTTNADAAKSDAPAAGSKTDTTNALPAAAAAGKATATAAGNADSGKDTFAQTCAGCHGPAAKGGMGPDLTTADGPTAWSDEQFITTLREGKTPTETLKPMMPHFTSDQLTDDKIKDIHAYLVTLK